MSYNIIISKYESKYYNLFKLRLNNNLPDETKRILLLWFYYDNLLNRKNIFV